MKRQGTLLITAAILLSGCVSGTLAVSDFNGSSVKITGHQWETDGLEIATAEAERICGKGPNKNAEFASQRILPNYQTEYLFLCL